MKPVWLLILAGATACSHSAVEAPLSTVGRTDVILQWNEQAVATGGPKLQRTLAMMHIAVFDAVNALEPRYQPYLRLPPPPDDASIEAVAAGAAHGVLVRLSPDQRQPLAAALTRSLAAVADGPAEADSVRYGDAVAQVIYDLRRGDRILLYDSKMSVGMAAGTYQLTAEHEQPINTRAREWMPFALASTAQFRPPGPPAITSREYARDVAEVRDIGRLVRERRSAEEEQVARWHFESGEILLNRIARAAATTDGRDVLEHARLFALLNIAMADAITGVFEAKYTYKFWRPVTAIRRAGEDGNDDTEPDVVWSPFLPTPPHPEYPAAHPAVQFAGARILTAHFGPAYMFETTSRMVPGARRRYAGFDAFAKEGGESRILAGLHFRTSVDHGAIMGDRIGAWVLEHALVPKKGR